MATLAQPLGAAMLKLDFIKVSEGYTSGWVPLGAVNLGDSSPSVTNAGGTGYNFSFTHVGSYDNQNSAQSLTRTGFYNINRLGQNHDFTLSGLLPGQTVKLYACAAWDGNGAGGYVLFGDNAPTGVQAQTIGNPGTAPALENLTYIGMATADGTGTVTGALHGRNGVGTDSEGQVGAFLFLPTQTITASAGAHGSISPAGPTGVTAGENKAFTITADSGYHVSDVLVDGASVGAVGIYNFNAVNADHTISASFAPNTVLYTINASAGANGSITPSGAVSANVGVNLPFSILPDPGYKIANVLVDGVSVGPVSDYSFTSVAANHTISASFAVKTYTIETTVGAHGSVSPTGTTTVNHGDLADFTITPDEGYYVAEVLVDGVSVGANNFYTFADVVANHTLQVSFDNRTRLYLDFTINENTPTEGWTKVAANYVAQTALATATNINGLGYNFSFSNVGAYDNNQFTEPLTRSGFFTFQNLTNPHDFTLTGLNAGQTVKLYATATWDGNAAGGYILYGDNVPNGVKAQTVGTPGLHPVVANMTLIGTAVSDSTGTVSGSLHGRNGVNNGVEGQVGGFLFILEAGGTPAANPFANWASSPPNNLTGADAQPGSDPDFDGVSNLLEFALNGSPISGTSMGRSNSGLNTVAAQPGVLTYTIAARGAASFAADGNRMKSAPVDGITYTVEASTALGTWGDTAVTEVTGADATTIQSGLPAPDAGWVYKTFRTPGVATNAKAFIRVKVD
ncbi:hypothetical protein [Haloferula sp. BvORR071]|uniref:InlB B-repeat-containing protein n=1 Tax=Haloferula sp. BvORR071 TaxID=1396141 RepID=UPI000A5EACF4|nr:hypothetical protein [Haloferula sp. BvORR071]